MDATDGAFDGPIEDITISIPVPVVAGTYDYFVHAWDSNGNRNDTSSAVQIIVVDDQYPIVSTVWLNGLSSLTVFPGTPVTVEAFVSDLWRGDSFIAGANYTIGVQNWTSSTPMNPSDGLFDQVGETVTSTPGTIDTTGWPDAVYQVCVYAWDIIPNNNTLGDCAPLTISSVDTERPWVYGVTLNNLPSVNVAPGSIVFLNATIDDTLAMGSNIQGANYSIAGAWDDANVLYPMDGTFDSPLEDVNTTIDTTGWSGGPYNICVSGWDDVPNYNSSFFVMACAQLTILTTDALPPLIINVLLNGMGSLTVAPGTTVDLTATIDDTTTNGSNILGANYTLNRTWPGTVMSPVDGFFDNVAEDVNATIDTTGWGDAIYEICVHGWDTVPNYHLAFDACVMLTVQTPDTTPPAISNIDADPDPQGPGENVRVSATVNDDVQVFEVLIEYRDPGGSSIGNHTMNYDSVNNEYYYIELFTQEGPHTFEIWAVDTSGNWAFASGYFIIVEQIPPTIDVTISNEDPEVGDTVTFEADVTDDSDIDEVRITITDPEGSDVVNNRHMSLDPDTGDYTYDYKFEMAGDYTYTITATDDPGNSNDESGTIAVSEGAGPSFLEEYWWLILVIVIIVVVLLLVGILMRRKPEVDEFVAEPTEAPPGEEPVEPPMEEPIGEPIEEPVEPPTEEVVEEPPPPEESAGAEFLDELEE
jgi:hypothetical protein